MTLKFGIFSSKTQVIPRIKNVAVKEEEFIDKKRDETVDYHESFEETPLWPAILTYLGLAIVILFGHIGDLLRKWGIYRKGKRKDPLQKVSLNN